jgi:small acid-soluble spore protein O (minor)
MSQSADRLNKTIQTDGKYRVTGGDVSLAKKKANHLMDEGMNAAKAQGKGAGYNHEFTGELTELEKQNNKKRKKNQ